MNRVLKLNLINCYGIKKMEETLTFTDEGNCNMLYASNGVMKTSLSKTLDKLSKGEYPKDEIFNKTTTFDVSYLNEVNNTNLESVGSLRDVFVVHSIDNTNDFATASSSLLANEAARKEFESIHKQLNTTINDFKSKLKKKLGIDCWKELGGFIDRSVNPIKNDESLLVSLLDFTKYPYQNDYINVKYRELFNNHTDKLFDNPDFIENVNEYTTLYKKLLSESKVYSENGFDPQNADTVLEQLRKTNFFKANHKVILNSDESSIIKSEQEFKKVLSEEKNRILSDDTMIKKFSSIEKLISNANTRKFRDIIKAHPEYIPLLIDRDTLERDFWLFTLNELKEDISVINKYISENRSKLLEIRKKAINDKTQWQSVVKEYNLRFHVPFELDIINKDDVILNLDLPVVVFKYKDTITGDVTTKNFESLQNVLSNGEKRALYFLNIIFKIETLKKENRKILIIFDDIADSFDYKNKYAIIQYLKEISRNNNFDVLILTHNYDFYRTLHTRLPIYRENCFIARTNQDTSVTFNNAVRGSETVYLSNVFANWIPQFSKKNNEIIMSASITFLRNLIEYRYNTKHQYYKLLTSLLHMKEETNQIIWRDIFPIVYDLFPNITKDNLSAPLMNKSVIESIFESANNVVFDSSRLQNNLENKVVLAMAIRLLAEKIALKILGVPYGEYGGNQTYELYKDVIDKGYILKDEELEIFEQVMIITPEHLHLNSFMFEPLIDTSIDSLVTLYKACKSIHDKETIPL